MQDDPKTLVSTDWLAKHIKDPDLRILDGSWYLPGMNRDALAGWGAVVYVISQDKTIARTLKGRMD